MLRRPRSALANLSCPWDLRHCLAVPESHTSPGHGPDVAFFPGAQLWRRLWGCPPLPAGPAVSTAPTRISMARACSGSRALLLPWRVSASTGDHRHENENPGRLGWGVFMFTLFIPDNSGRSGEAGSILQCPLCSQQGPEQISPRNNTCVTSKTHSCRVSRSPQGAR